MSGPGGENLAEAGDCLPACVALVRASTEVIGGREAESTRIGAGVDDHLRGVVPAVPAQDDEGFRPIGQRSGDDPADAADDDVRPGDEAERLGRRDLAAHEGLIDDGHIPDEPFLARRQIREGDDVVRRREHGGDLVHILGQRVTALVQPFATLRHRPDDREGLSACVDRRRPQTREIQPIGRVA